MRFGTLVATERYSSPLPGFADSGVHELAIQRLLAAALVKHRLTGLADRVRSLRRWQGDLAVGGKGEILTAP